jgi:beta-phosphoglucomutase-like phosphatase (HAD superfamily)
MRKAMRGKVFLLDMDGTLIGSIEVIEEIRHHWADRLIEPPRDASGGFRLEFGRI